MPTRCDAPWQAQSRLVREKLLQDSLKMFTDLGLDSHEMSRAANLPLGVVEDGLERMDRSKSSTGQRSGGLRTVRGNRATDFEARQKEADHRIANSIQIAAAMLKHASRGITDAASARDAIECAILRLTAIARMHRQLSQDAPDGDVDLAHFIRPFCADIAQSIGAIVDVKAMGVTLRADAATQICVILNELAINAVKHGGLAGTPVILSVHAERHKNGQLQITLRDNGRGLPSGFSLRGKDSLGMTIITSTVEKLGGSLRPLHGAGAGFEIMLPYEGRRNGLRNAGKPAGRHSPIGI